MGFLCGTALLTSNERLWNLMLEQVNVVEDSRIEGADSSEG